MEERNKELKKEKNQIVYAIILFAIIIIFCALLWNGHKIYAISLGIGSVIGIVLRYSRFCFAAAFRDPFITGNTKVMRAVILGLIVSTIGFGLVHSGYQHSQAGNYDKIPGAIGQVGPGLIIGAFIFGIGMVLAGGCVSGLLMRIGEGHTIYLLVLAGFIIGNSLGGNDYGGRIVYFPDYISLKIVVLVQIIVLIIMYKFALYYEKKHTSK